MWILSIDPASTRAGYALMEDNVSIHDAGVFVAKAKRPPCERIDMLVRDLHDAIDDEWAAIPIERVVIEGTSGKVGRYRHGGGGAGLSIYGQAVGELRRACIAAFGDDIVKTIAENTWTGGVPKDKRQRMIALQFAEYCADDDKGGDVADAIGLNLWYRTLHALRT